MLPVLPPDLQPEAYLVVGLAHCFWKEETGLRELELIEPIPSAALETLLQGVPTSYSHLVATTLAQVETTATQRFPSAQLCPDFWERAIAAARTYRHRPQATQHLPLGAERNDLNFSLERKRVLNSRRTVRDSDNIRQHPHTHQQL
ncbi:MAG: hypothetical protein NZL92_02600 [Gloeomargarita sp. SKYG116]|nr:hypothetical protein [Gloeomargarita sp. SKYG116]MCS7226263.1 hypothetical protein [Gloeomargarita sp. SKYB31]MDW8400568.1 hypothetical protein [Gloeomargarita sp. SKYGB_i_bin116]